MDEKPKKEKMRFGTKMVIISMGGMVSYTLLLFFLALLSLATGQDISMPNDWNGYIFAFLTIELVSLAALRMPEKVKSKYEKEDKDDEGGTDPQSDE